MNHFLKWLGSRLFGRRLSDEQSLRQTGSRISPAAPTPKLAARRAPAVALNPSVSGSIVDGGPGKNVLLRNRHVREDTGTHDTLKIIDDSLVVSDEESGIDPYNTGRFDRSKSWNSSNRK